MSRLRATASFLVWFSGQFLRANVVVLREVLTPGHSIAPAVVEVSLRSRSILELATITNLMSLVPGSLALTVDGGPDGPRMVVHGMHAADPEALRAEVRELEDRMLACLRRDDGRRAVGLRTGDARHLGETGGTGDPPEPDQDAPGPDPGNRLEESP